MEHHESVVARNAKIVGIAGLAAGLLGGLASWVLSSQRERPARARPTGAAELTGRDVESIKATIAEAAKAGTPELADTAQREGEGAQEAKNARRPASRRGLPRPRESFGEHMKSAPGKARAAGEALQEALGETTSTLHHVSEDVDKRSAEVSQRQGSVARRRASERESGASKPASRQR